MLKYLFHIFSIFTILSCIEKEKDLIANDLEISNNFSFDNLNEINFADTLYIKSKFSECGEWGGHYEEMKIFPVKRDKIILIFKRNKVENCFERDSLGSIVQHFEIEKEINLSKNQKIALMNYINNLTKSKFLQSGFSNAGNTFSVENFKENFKISISNEQTFNVDSYNDLLKVLKIPIVKNTRFEQ